MFPNVRNNDFAEKDIVLQADMSVSPGLLFDATGRWPLGDGEYDMVILGDVLEHVDAVGAIVMIDEARRVGKALCITVPNDDRLGPGWHTDGSRDPEEEWVTEPGSYHVQQVTEKALRAWLHQAEWKIKEWRTVPYGFCDEGYFVLCE